MLNIRELVFVTVSVVYINDEVFYNLFYVVDTINFDDLQAYDVADLLKQYFRELPECLMTNKLSEIFLNIFICEYLM